MKQKHKNAKAKHRIKTDMVNKCQKKQVKAKSKVVAWLEERWVVIAKVGFLLISFLLDEMRK